MKNKLKYAIMFVGALICSVAVGNYITAPIVPDNTKSIEYTYEVQNDGSLKPIEEQERVPMTITYDVLPNVFIGIMMILWAIFMYPKKQNENSKQ